MTTDTQPLHRQLGMTDEEHESVLGLLGRDPTAGGARHVLGDVVGALLLQVVREPTFAASPPRRLGWWSGPGENAGVVDLGDGWLAALRIESHNHPSFVEPYQGAATGVGGILRDVFTMGARPIALWDPIRFGPLDDPKNRYLFNGVVSGIAGYGNAVGRAHRRW